MDLTKLKTYSIKKRKSKINKAFFARPLKRGESFRDFWGSLPNILKSKDLKDVVSALIRARKKKKPVILLCGAHVIKCGLSTILIQLLEKRLVTGLALNGAGVIHDFEIAFCGQTSEDVALALEDGSFGMAQETADFINGAVARGVQDGLGLGSSVGRQIHLENLKNKELSLAYQCWRLKRPLTVHVAIGTDIIHQHASFSGAQTGEASMRDFHALMDQVAELDGGGVVLNIGSAVVLPEVFLKALSVARNVSGRVRDFTTVNFDMNFHYRPYQNIVTRPVSGSGRGYYLIGHHEIMLPLLAAALIEEQGR